MKTTTDRHIPNPVLFLGDQGEAVRDMQRLINRRLAQLGADFPFRSTSTQFLLEDGDFGQKTLAAVRYIQCVSFLDTDGIVGRKTWSYLVDGPAGLPELRLGDQAPELQQVQAMFNIPDHGQFDLRTKRLIRSIQRRYDMFESGVLDTDTWNLLILLKVDSHTCDVFLSQG